MHARQPTGPEIFWLLRVESRDFSQAKKERTSCKAEQIHKTTTIFTQNDKFFAALSENDFQFVEFAKL